MDGVNLEGTLTDYMNRVEQTEKRMDSHEHALAALQAITPFCIQKFQMIRYNAFDNIGGEQSFAIAILDGQGDGLILTGIHSRTEMRVYAKTIRNGHASHQLSEEEERALRGAATT